MDPIADGRLNPDAFDADLMQATDGLNAVLAAASRSGSCLVESTHFLVALSEVPRGLTQRLFTQAQVPVQELVAGLLARADRGQCDEPPLAICPSSLSPTGRATLDDAAGITAQWNAPVIGEGHLLIAGLRNLTPRVAEGFRDSGVDTEWVAHAAESATKPFTAVAAFGDEGNGGGRELLVSSFAPGGWRIVELMLQEAEALGYERLDPRHLLLALLETDGGATRLVVHQQTMSPKTLEQLVMLSLRGRARGRRSSLSLDSSHIRPALQEILEDAGRWAGRDEAEQIEEVHLARAFFDADTAARQLLRDSELDTDRAREALLAYDYTQQHEEAEQAREQMNPQTLRQRLSHRIVGQEDVLERVFPLIRRMQFGYSRLEKPAGVFLFCGQSGSGKTETAKVLAELVYGDCQALIHIEMGQFTTRESVNVFIGAPPGYVGYGEGRLTNGLRDKPRSVVLFDEVEKAKEPAVLDALLRLLDEGRIDDPSGAVRDATNCIIVLTSNASADRLSALWEEADCAPNGHLLLRGKLKAELQRYGLRPEFLNRVDEVLLFRALDESGLSEIAKRQLLTDLQRLRDEHQVHVALQPGLEEVAVVVGRYCARLNEGARPVMRVLNRAIIDPVIDCVMSCDTPGPWQVMVGLAQTAEEDEPTGVVRLGPTEGRCS